MQNISQRGNPGSLRTFQTQSISGLIRSQTATILPTFSPCTPDRSCSPDTPRHPESPGNRVLAHSPRGHHLAWLRTQFTDHAGALRPEPALGPRSAHAAPRSGASRGWPGGLRRSSGLTHCQHRADAHGRAGRHLPLEQTQRRGARAAHLCPGGRRSVLGGNVGWGRRFHRDPASGKGSQDNGGEERKHRRSGRGAHRGRPRRCGSRSDTGFTRRSLRTHFREACCVTGAGPATCSRVIACSQAAGKQPAHAKPGGAGPHPLAAGPRY